MKRLAGWSEVDAAVGRLALLDGDAAQQFGFVRRAYEVSTHRGCCCRHCSARFTGLAG